MCAKIGCPLFPQASDPHCIVCPFRDGMQGGALESWCKDKPNCRPPGSLPETKLSSAFDLAAPSVLQLNLEPGSGEGPTALGGSLRDSEEGGSFLELKAREEVELDEIGIEFVELGKLDEGVV